MRKRYKLLTIATLLSASVTGFLLAESGPSSLVVGITEGPDPIPRVIWEPNGRIYPGAILGEGRSDGRPDVSLDPAGNPVVAWSYKDGEDTDVALLRWLGEGWSPVDFVTSGSAVELDPRAFVSFGGIQHVVWWLDSPSERVFYVQGQPPRGFGYPELVGREGRRPSVAVLGAAVLVAYERSSAGGSQEIVLASRDALGGFTVQTLFEVEREEPLDVVLHAAGDQLWMDWKSSESEMAFSERVDGVWSTPILVPWADTSWAGSEELRSAIRKLVLAGASGGAGSGGSGTSLGRGRPRNLRNR